MCNSLKKALSFVLVLAMIMSMACITNFSVSAETNQYKLGDVNMDGSVNVKDASLIQRYSASLVDFTEDEKYLANVNGDKSVNVKDATYIQRFLAALITDYSVNADGYKIDDTVTLGETVPTTPSSDPTTTETSPTTKVTEATTNDVTEATTKEVTEATTKATEVSTVDYSKYSLIGYIDGADVGCEKDSENVPNVFAKDGTQTLTFAKDSYVFVKTTDNAKWYMFDKFCEDTTGTLKLSVFGDEKAPSEKMFVPAGTVTFTLVENSDDTLTLSYVTGESETTKATEATTATVTEATTTKATEATTATTTEATTTKATEASKTTTVYVGVISYIVSNEGVDGLQVHYWNDGGLEGDANCTALKDVTVKKTLGSSLWSGAEQTFYMYTAEVPSEATGYKAHISNRWFGDEGDLATTNTAYIYNYDGDQAVYDTYTAEEPSTTKATEGTTTDAKTVTYKYYFAPLASDIKAGYGFAVNILDTDGNYKLYKMTATDETYNGLAVYEATITVAEGSKIAKIQYQTHDYSLGTSSNETWKHQIAKQAVVDYSEYNNKIMVATSEGDGNLVDYKVDDTTSTQATTAKATETTTVSSSTATVYLATPSADDNGKADYYAWTWKDGENGSAKQMTLGSSGYYETQMAAGTNVVFVRMPAGTTFDGSESSWANKWNQSENTKFDGTNNLCTLSWGEGYGADMTAKWTVYSVKTTTEATTATATEATTTKATEATTKATEVSTVDYSKYSLVGNIDGEDVGCEKDSANVPNVFAKDGTQTLTFAEKSYVFVKTTDNAKWYMFDKYCEDTTGTLKLSVFGEENTPSEKMLVPAGTVTFTLVENADGTLTLSYVTAEAETTKATEATTATATEATTATTTEATTATEASKTTVYVGVISYIVSNEGVDGLQVHYWNDGGLVGDVDCTALKDVTVKKALGSSLWSGAEQTFYMYTAEIPAEATGYKAHIGNRWFGDEGDLAKTNTAYIYNYDGDQAVYGTYTAEEPSTTKATEGTTTDAKTVTYKYYFAPLASDIKAGYGFAVNILDTDGNYKLYKMTATDETYNGLAVYEATITVAEGSQIAKIQYQTHDYSLGTSSNETWKHQIAKEAVVDYSEYDNKIMVATSEGDGDIKDYVADKATEATTTEVTEATTVEATEATTTTATETTTVTETTKATEATTVSSSTATVYLATPSADDNGKADYYAWTWKDGEDGSAKQMTLGSSGYYETQMAAGTNVVFVRMPAGTTFDGSESSWANKWNQSENTKFDGTNNLCTLSWGEGYGADMTAKWTVYSVKTTTEATTATATEATTKATEATEATTTEATEATTVTETTATEATTVTETTKATEATTATEASKTTVYVGVISYIVSNEGVEGLQVHYWNDGGLVGDVDCTALKDVTVKKALGSSLWSGAEQTFYMYTAEIPAEATGYKAHIGNRWFGDEGDLAKTNTAYIYNYDGDQAVYGTYTSEEPSTTKATEATTVTATEAKTVTYKYYFAPLASDVKAGYGFAVNILDTDGNYKLYKMTATDETYNGLAVYEATITVAEGSKIAKIQYQTHDYSLGTSANETWKHQIAKEAVVDYSEYDNKIMVATSEGDGDIKDYVADKATEVTEATTVEATTTEATETTTVEATEATTTEVTEATTTEAEATTVTETTATEATTVTEATTATTEATEATTATEASKTTVYVGVISYIVSNEGVEGLQVHYWNDGGLVGDVDCTALKDVTVKKALGSSLWSGAEQTFYMYTAEVPSEATGYKVHISNRWFGDEGDLAKTNTAYIYNYDGDQAVYGTYTAEEPSTTKATEATTVSETTKATEATTVTETTKATEATTVTETTKATEATTATEAPKTTTVYVGVISYVQNEGVDNLQVHYWNNSNLAGDADCTILKDVTVKKSVGSSYWSGAEQTFYIYSAEVPVEATSYKVHKGNTWYGSDGDLTTTNIAYVFNYSGDQALYDKYSADSKTTDTDNTTNTNTVTVKVVNNTNWLYNDSAALFFYDSDTGKHYAVNSTTGEATISATATKLTLYRCNGEWGSGSKTDSVTTYWNKFEATRTTSQYTFTVNGSSSFAWS
jgi:hypothetical protein